MRLPSPEVPQPNSLRRQFLWALLLYAAVLCLFFFHSFLPGETLFSNDGPLGRLLSECHQMPERFRGSWEDLNGVGYSEGAASTNLTYGLLCLLGPVAFSKFYAPIALLILGISAWGFFRRLAFSPPACLLGGLAAMLNSTFFSAACWGVASHALTAAMAFLALTALVDAPWPRRWLRTALAGFALGMAVMEGADIGALFSLLVAGVFIFETWTSEEPHQRKLAMTLGRLALVTLVAAAVASEFIVQLATTAEQGSSGTGQDTRTKTEKWDWATQWSLPKREGLTVVIPGLFGYRMDALDGGNYWGAAGRDPAWDRYFGNGREGSPPAGFIRYSGGGQYAGLLVALVASWAAMQSFRRESSIFAPAQRKRIWLWSGAAMVSLLLAFGRHAPFYRLVYALPFASLVRNPAKFLHLFSFALVVLFVFGIEGLALQNQRMTASNTNPKPQTRRWWAGASRFDKAWAAGCVLAVVASFLGWCLYASGRPSLEQYLQSVQFDSTTAEAIAGFSIKQAGWFVVFLAVTVFLLLLVWSGMFAGRHATLSGILLALLLLVDLGRADRPWITYWNYPWKYASNPIVDLLRQSPCEQRVATLPPWLGYTFRFPQNILVAENTWDQLYALEWSQHLFPFYNVQSLDIVQMRLVPPDWAAFQKALQCHGTAEDLYLLRRQWELTNTRYLLGSAEFLGPLNRALDPRGQKFRIAARFDLIPKPGIIRPIRFEDLTVNLSSNGDFALFEFGGALSRAILYTNWQVDTNGPATLQKLAGTNFDPQTVLVFNPLPSPVSSAPTNSGMVKFLSYAPKRVVLHASAPAPSVLLLNDKFDPNWNVFVDGERKPLLRCNYIMRGVFVPSGEHDVEFRFNRQLPKTLCVSLAAVLLGMFLAGYAAFADLNR